MGSAVDCTFRLAGKAARGTVLLETDVLLFRGQARLRVPFSAIRSVTAEGGVLRVEHTGGTAEIDLGAKAEAWAGKIAAPKGRLQKLGVKAGAKVALVGAFDDEFRAELGRATPRVTEGARGSGHDLVIFAPARVADLARVGALAARVVVAGGVWVVYPKGRADLPQADVLAAGRAAGLKDVKVARFSETHTALKFVTPLARRGRGESSRA